MGGSLGSTGGSGAGSMVFGITSAAAAAAAVEPQMVTVTVQGSVLAKAHVKAGAYVPAAQKTSALKLLEGESMTGLST